MKMSIIIGLLIVASLAGVLSFKKSFLKNYPVMPTALNTPPSLTATKITLQSTPSIGSPYPSEVLDLTNWKITLPIGEQKDAKEIKQPELATYKIDPWFIPEANGIRFRAPVNGMTTVGSKYPRSELREMTNNGKTKASWSFSVGTHIFFVEQAISAVPKKKQHVVASQIHDGTQDILVIRLEYPSLFINVDGKNVSTLDNHYTLGKRFTVKFVVSGGQTKVYYNNNNIPSYTLTKNYSGVYFKVGAYTQSNCDKEGSASLCNANNYGEVIVYQASVTHLNSNKKNKS